MNTMSYFVVKKSEIFFGMFTVNRRKVAKFDEHIFICFKWIEITMRVFG